jgi:hypothetical protein
VIWHVSPAELPFSSSHDDRFWAATAEHNNVNMKLFQSINSPYELIYSGMLERFPRVKVVLVENQLGWIPFVLEQ